MQESMICYVTETTYLMQCLVTKKMKELTNVYQSTMLYTHIHMYAIAMCKNYVYFAKIDILRYAIIYGLVCDQCDKKKTYLMQCLVTKKRKEFTNVYQSNAISMCKNLCIMQMSITSNVQKCYDLECGQFD